jgi:hypothetical protein
MQKTSGFNEKFIQFFETFVIINLPLKKKITIFKV